METNSTMSKRSFALVASATIPSPPPTGCNSCTAIATSASPESCELERTSSPFKRRSIVPALSIMPVQTSQPSVPDSFPSFMSVFGGRLPNNPEEERIATTHPFNIPPHVTVNTSRRPLPFQHRTSVSSATSASTDSSPTTTISTFDSPSAADTSPSSSPESPSSMPISYPKFMPPARKIESQTLSANQNNMDEPSLDTPMLKRPDSPGRRARNLKNLSLRMPPPSQSSRPPIATAPVVDTGSQHHLSAPPSPMHAPPKSSRRKPANLTIRTPGFDRSFSNSLAEMVPPTPHGRQSLRHTESSPSLTSIFSPSFGPKGGMQLPRPVTHHGSRRPSNTSDEGLSPVQSANEDGSFPAGVLPELEEEDDHLDSRESTRRSERGYPDGPVKIYDSGVYLYLEPTMKEASQFDVVVNVAKEVANPFTNTNANNGTVVSTLRNASTPSNRLSVVDPGTAVSDASFKSAFEYPQPETSSPATPRKESEPEYIHVGWDHNSEILDDLYPLCDLIDSRVSDGKKVLIHCQLGASRSASLVIAYGLYKNRDLDFNSMYEVVKGRSRWVGPNMSLIYQLTDFRSRLLRGSPSKPAPQEWFVGGPRRCSEPQVPRSGRMGAPEMVTPVSSVAGQSSTNGFSQSSTGSLSIPSTNQTTPTSADSLSFSKSLSHKRSLSPRPLPLRQSSFHTLGAAFRSASESTWNPEGGPYSLAKTDVFVRDAPDEPSAFFSPRTTGFLAAPIPRSVPGGFEQASQGLQFQARTADPRSPPPGNERLIMRNIDEFL